MMLLINKISLGDFLSYKEEQIKCLIHNANNGAINEIYVFIDGDDKKLPKHNKIRYFIKKNFEDYQMLEISKKYTTQKKIVWSKKSLLGFTDDLKFLAEEPLCYKSKDFLIINKNTKINPNLSIEEDFKNPKIITIDFSTTKKTINKIIESEDSSTLIRKKGQLVKTEPKYLSKKLDVIIISVNYNDFLLTTLSRNVKIFENITVVTSSEDLMCKMICDKFGINCLVTDVMYESGAVFNKGKAINFAINSLKNPGFILLIDADIIVKEKIITNNLDIDILYTSDRWMCETYQDLIHIEKTELINNIEKEVDKGLGFFQLFHITKANRYPESSDNAAFSDLLFRDKFPKKETIKNTVIHLGKSYTNWDGRKTDRFIEDDDFQKLFNFATSMKFDINKYFDKIFCLNLERREDKWISVSKEFQRFNINVERFIAVDGNDISDEQFDFFKSKYSTEQSSNLGLLENKAALGCLLSHTGILKFAKLNGYKRILIFEDDIKLSDNFLERIEEIKDFDWNLFYLGASQFDWSEIDIKNNYYNCKKTLGTFAWAVDESIFDKLIEIFETQKKSVDNLLSDFQISNREKSFVLYPNIVISDVSTSEIRNSKDMSEYSDLMRWDVKNFETEEKTNSQVIENTISIIIPCFGHSQYLDECVNSCLAQKKLPDEIIILLMDEESQSLKSELESKSNIIKCINSTKLCLSQARNKLVSYTNCSHFIPLDADDTLPENFVEETSKISADVVYVGAKYFGNQNGTWPVPIEEEIDWKRLTTFRRNSLVCTALIKKQSFLDSGLYNSSLWAFEDMDLWIRMYSNNFNFIKCFTTHLNYRKHGHSQSLLSVANSSEDNRSDLKKIILKNKFYSKTPKIIHWVWLGEKPFPKDIIDTWMKTLPYGEWSYMLWNEHNFDINSSNFLKKSYQQKKYGICVDYIRAKVLYEFGGVWLDADCIINQDVTPFLQYDFFASWENESFINIGLIGCSPKLEIFKNILDYYQINQVTDEIINSQEKFVSEIGTGPMVLTKEISKIKDLKVGGHALDFQINNKKYLIETPDVFVLDDSENGRPNYAVHLFDGSWTEKKEEWSHVVRKSYNQWKNNNGLK